MNGPEEGGGNARSAGDGRPKQHAKRAMGICREIKRNLDGAVCLSLSGEVDLSNIAEFRADLSAAIRAADALILDMQDLRYLDSSGINVLLEIHRYFSRENRRVAVVGPSAMVRRILTVVGLDQLMPVFGTVEEALSHVGPKGRGGSPQRA